MQDRLLTNLARSARIRRVVPSDVMLWLDYESVLASQELEQKSRRVRRERENAVQDENEDVLLLCFNFLLFYYKCTYGCDRVKTTMCYCACAETNLTCTEEKY